MITRLILRNFRRHPDTDVTFNPSDQLIAITGNNGMGKSTLIGEALLFAFFGESRHGRRQLDNLVMRGAELAGCEVTVEFTIDDQLYRVERRRLERISSAVLYCEGAVLASSPAAVEAEMSRLLGLDASGFKLAVLAKQKELDGLVALDKRSRRLQVGRLLRLDAIARSAAEASKRYSDALALTRALGPKADLSPVVAELEVATASCDATRRLAEDTRRQLADLDGTVKRAEPLIDAYNAAVAAHQAALGALREAEHNDGQAVAMCLQIQPGPAPDAPQCSSDDLRDEIARVKDALSQARSAEQILADLELLGHDLAQCEIELARAEAVNAAAAAAEIEVVAAVAALERLTEDRAAAAAALESARTVRASASAALTAAAAAVSAAGALDSLCVSCGQPITADHRDEQLLVATAAHEHARGAESDAEAALATARRAYDAADAAMSDGAERLRAQRSVADQRDVARQTELARRRNTYLVRLNRPHPPQPDVDALQGELTALSGRLRAVCAAERAVAEHSTASARYESSLLVAEAARARLDAARQAVTASVPAPNVEAAAKQALADLASRNELAVAAQGLSDALAMAERTCSAVAARLAAVTAANDRIDAAAADAHGWALTKAVLSDTHSTLSAALRPALASTLSSLLSRLSDGRFESVTVDEDFEIRVADGGAYRSLGDCSGGESDLIALALRLALSRLISDAVGGNNLGILVLDEVFGSQDPTRRATILEALRELRGEYGQIFIISHVGGLEEASDKVVELSSDDGVHAVVTVIG